MPLRGVVAPASVTWRDGWRVLWPGSAHPRHPAVVARGVLGRRRYGLPILAAHRERPRRRRRPRRRAEILRGLGYWFFYGATPRRPWLDGLATPYSDEPAAHRGHVRPPVVALAFARGVAVARRGTTSRCSWRSAPCSRSAPSRRRRVHRQARPSRAPAASRISCCRCATRNGRRRSSPSGWPGSSRPGSTALSRRHVRVARRRRARHRRARGSRRLPAQWRTGLIAERFSARRDPVVLARRRRRARRRARARAGAARASTSPLPVGPHPRPGSRSGSSIDRSIARELIPIGGAPGRSTCSRRSRSQPAGGLVRAGDARSGGPPARRDRRPRPQRPRVRALPHGASARPVASGQRRADGPRGRRRRSVRRLPNVAAPDRPMIDEIELGLDPHDARAARGRDPRRRGRLLAHLEHRWRRRWRGDRR